MITNPIDVFTHHGVQFNGLSTDTEYISACPFCGKDAHFYVNKKEGLFDCKHCGKSGNAYTFLQLLHEQCLFATTKNQYNRLSRARSLPSSAFSDAELAYDPSCKRWIIPVRNAKGTMVNLRWWSPPRNGEKNPLMGTKSCGAAIHGLHNLQKTGPIYLCEGEWDAVALEWLLLKNKVSEASVLAVPGAGTFKAGWERYFEGRDIILAYDNDEPGIQGAKKVARTLSSQTFSKRPASIKIVEWPESYPDKYDINDFVARHKKNPTKGYKTFRSLLSEYSPGEDAGPAVRVNHSFQSVLKIFKKNVYVNQEFIDALALCCAIVHSSKLEHNHNPIWLFLVGPPSCGKTLILNCFKNCANSYYASKINATQLVSGRNSKDGSDPSIIPKILGKCFILKDFTEITTMSTADQDQIYGVLRGFYDGSVERPYGIGLHRTYEGFCSILAGVTPAIFKESRVTLGERFLKFQMIRPGYDQEKHVRHSLNAHMTPEKEKLLQDTISNFLDRNIDQDNLPQVTEEQQEKLTALSQVIAHLRAVVERRRDEILYRPCPEIGTRLAKQFIKLASFLAIVLDLEEPDAVCYNLVEKVALDTATGWHQDVCVEIARHPKGIRKTDLCDQLQISPSSVERSLNDLLDLSAICYRKVKGSRGRPVHIWKLSRYFRRQWRLAGLFESKNLGD